MSHAPSSGTSFDARHRRQHGRIVLREEQHRREHRREPRQARALGDDGRGIRDRVRHEQVGARDGARELLVRSLELRHQQLADDDLAAFDGIHHALVQIGSVRVVGVDVGTELRELDAFALDVRAIAAVVATTGPCPRRFSASASPMYGKRSPCEPQHVMTMRLRHNARVSRADDEVHDAAAHVDRALHGLAREMLADVLVGLARSR